MDAVGHQDDRRDRRRRGSSPARAWSCAGRRAGGWPRGSRRAGRCSRGRRRSGKRARAARSSGRRGSSRRGRARRRRGRGGNARSRRWLEISSPQPWPTTCLERRDLRIGVESSSRPAANSGTVLRTILIWRLALPARCRAVASTAMHTLERPATNGRVSTVKLEAPAASPALVVRRRRGRRDRGDRRIRDRRAFARAAR